MKENEKLLADWLIHTLQATLHALHAHAAGDDRAELQEHLEHLEQIANLARAAHRANPAQDYPHLIAQVCEATAEILRQM